MEKVLRPLTVLQEDAERFILLLRGTHDRIETCGCVRRGSMGTGCAYVVVPRPDPTGNGPHLVYNRLLELQAKGKLQPWQTPAGYQWFDPDCVLLMVNVGGVCHEITIATGDNWGYRVAEATGPGGYFRMLRHRLMLAGALKLHGGHVCLVKRHPGGQELVPIPVYEERDFFRLARTSYRSPQYRFERHSSDNRADWSRGVQPEWYPPGVIPYADPHGQPALFESSTTLSAAELQQRRAAAASRLARSPRESSRRSDACKHRSPPPGESSTTPASTSSANPPTGAPPSARSSTSSGPASTSSDCT